MDLEGSLLHEVAMIPWRFVTQNAGFPADSAAVTLTLYAMAFALAILWRRKKAREKRSRRGVK